MINIWKCLIDNCYAKECIIKHNIHENSRSDVATANKNQYLSTSTSEMINLQGYEVGGPRQH